MVSLKKSTVFIIAAWALLCGSNSYANSQIVASIKPVELLVRAIATNDMHTTTLVPPGASPHNYSMTPSKRRALAAADVIFWVGPDMETFLSRLLSSDDLGPRSVALGGASDDSAGATHHHHEHHPVERTGQAHAHSHHHGEGEDPHIWVDPQSALAMAATIRDTLVQRYTSKEAALNRNFTRLKKAISQQENTLKQQLMPLQGISLFAYHSAFNRFAEHYNLNLVRVLTLNPELSPGAKHLADVQSRLQTAHHPCLLIEPQFNRQWWRSITNGLDVTLSTWDPLATDIEATAGGYVAFQQSIADALLQCLPQEAEH